MYSACLCSKKAFFKPFIKYENETVFKDFEGLIIGKCKKCGLLKTFAPEKSSFDPKRSRDKMYESQQSYFTQLFLPIVQKIKEYKSSGNVLDVGCSSGLFLGLLKKENYDIYGIEPNKEAFIIAKKKFGNNIFHGTLTKFLTNKRYNYSNNCSKKYDVIIYNHVLEHIEDIQSEIKLIKNILKNDGIFVLGLPNTSNYIFYLRKKYWEPLMPLEHIWHFSKQYLVLYLKKNGFTVTDISFSDDSRSEYPLLKRLYFFVLSLINKLFYTGEAMLLILKK